MAAVVNERDVLMRSAAARVVDVSLPSNVKPVQLVGISLVAPASMFRVTPGGVSSPTAIEITAVLRGLSDSSLVTWSVTSGTATLTGAGLTRTLAYSGMSTDLVVVQASVTDNGLTYSSSLSFFKVHETTGGLPGPREAMSVSRAIAGSSWSDTEALAALTDAGASSPVATDTCALFNVSVGYSETRRYSGATWVPVAASLSGPTLAPASITTEKLLVTGLGVALNSDPGTKDITAWSGSGISIVADSSSPSGATVLRCTGTGTDIQTKRFAVDPTQNYRVRGWLKQVSGAGTAYLFVAFFDATGAVISADVDQASWAHAGQYHFYGLYGVTPAPAWTEYSTSFGAGETSKIPTNARFAAVGLLPNFTETGETRLTGLLCHLKTTGEMVVDGSITAKSIDTRGLSIKDEDGHDVITAGTSGPLISKRINLAVADGLFAGTDLDNGVYFGSGGLVAKKAGVVTFSLVLDGSAHFAGELTAMRVSSGGVIVDPTGFIRGGQTAYNTGNGFWLGESSGTYKLSIGSPTGQGLTYDGTNLRINGTFTADAVDAVSTINLAGNSVTVPVTATWAGYYYLYSGQIVAAPSADFGGQPVLITAQVTVSNPEYGAGVRVQIYRNGSVVATGGSFESRTGPETPVSITGTIVFIDYPGEGSHVYGVGSTSSTAGLGYQANLGAVITAVGVKR